MTDYDDEDDLYPNQEIPEPCTARARRYGCTCTMESVNSASIDPPEPIVDRYCPLHGNAPDPDYERDQRIEDERNPLPDHDDPF